VGVGSGEERYSWGHMEGWGALSIYVTVPVDASKMLDVDL